MKTLPKQQYLEDINIFKENLLKYHPNPYKFLTKEKLEEEIGEADSLFFGRVAELKKETNLGRLITRAQNDLLQTDVGIMSDRGIRDNLPMGKLTYESVLRVLPFHNTICLFELNGEELKSYIEKLPDVVHFDGIKIYKKNNKIVKMEVGGKIVVPHTKYKVSLNIHNAAGGSLWPDQSKNPTFIDSGFDHAFVLKSYIQKIKTLKSADFSSETVINLP